MLRLRSHLLHSSQPLAESKPPAQRTGGNNFDILSFLLFVAF
jgi:hypothetical protein